MMSRVWGRHAPTRSLRKCRRIEEVKSQWSTTFSRIENLWPRDGSCPLPLRSKRFISKCFRIVKTQKISKRSLLMYGSHRLLRTKFLPLFVQRRGLESRYHVRTAHEIFKVRSQKRKRPPTQYRRRILSGETAAKRSGVLRGGTFFLGNHPLKVVVIMVRTTTFQAGFGIEGIMEAQVRQDGFAKFIAVKR